MSDNPNISLLALISFAVGVMVGAVVTLFLAPMSGRELRTQIHDHAQADWQRATDQMHRTQAEMRQAMDQMRQQVTQLQAKLDRRTASEEEVEGTA